MLMPCISQRAHRSSAFRAAGSESDIDLTLQQIPRLAGFHSACRVEPWSLVVVQVAPTREKKQPRIQDGSRMAGFRHIEGQGIL